MAILKAPVLNIGAEGQFIMGSLAAAFFGYFFKLPPIIHPIVCIILAALALTAERQQQPSACPGVHPQPG